MSQCGVALEAAVEGLISMVRHSRLSPTRKQQTRHMNGWRGLISVKYAQCCSCSMIAASKAGFLVATFFRPARRGEHNATP